MAKFGIGQAVRRVEDHRFVRGEGRYVDDITLPGECHGVTVLSPHAHARIRRLYVHKAMAAPGVLCVLHGADVAVDELGAMTAHLMPEDFGAPRGHRTYRPLPSWRTRSAASATASRSWLPRRSRKRATRLS